MKANAGFTAPGAKGGLFEDPSTFFNSGKGRKWETKLSAAQVARYDAKIARLLSADEVRLLEPDRKVVVQYQ